MKFKGIGLLLLVLGCACGAVIAGRQHHPIRVGGDDDGRFVLPTGQIVKPYGDVVQFSGRPVDLVLSPDHHFLFVKDNRGIVVIDVRSWSVRQESKVEGGTSMHGIAVSADGSRLYVTNAQSELVEGEIAADGLVSWKRRITLQGFVSGASYPCGIALLQGGERALVCLSRDNSVAIVDLTTGLVVTTIPVEVAPWDIKVLPDSKLAIVSNWGGRKPHPGEATAVSSGTPVLIDGRGVARSGCVSFIDLVTESEVGQVETGLHPSSMALTADGTRLFVANANSDTVSVIDVARRRQIQTVSAHSHSQLLFGSAPDGLALSVDDKTLYVANAGNNAIATVDLERLGRSNAVSGLIPTAWYPGALISEGTTLYVANVKGIGSRHTDKDKDYQKDNETSHGSNVYQFAGSVSRFQVPDKRDLDRLTTAATADARIPESVRALIKSPPQRPLRAGKGVPVTPPARDVPGFVRHVVYIIKENRTYDQLLGDMPKGDGDADLCLFGKEITPNHHALAEQFVLLDNFYCNGVLSADGHSWATEGNVTDHLEKAFGGFTRSYTFGDDPLTYSSSGFIWDDFLVHGLSFRNYGEMDYAEPAAKTDFVSLLTKFNNGEKLPVIHHNVGIENLRRHTFPEYPGWNLSIPDVVRAGIFLRSLRHNYIKTDLPNFTLIYLPNDHTGADVSARSYLADNDLALGRIVDGISHSRFWSTTCIFVVEDDPQSGFDHVDGHRSICLVASPYVKRGSTIHNFYNQTSVLHTIEAMFGLPPMNQFDAQSPLMSACFSSVPDHRPYNALINTTPLTETKQALSTLMRKSAAWSKLAKGVNFSKPDASDDDVLNRLLWREVRGLHSPMPMIRDVN